MDKNKTNVRIGQLFNIKLLSGVILNYQNFLKNTTYNFLGVDYQYMRIAFTGSTRNITGENTPVTIELPNVEPLKSFVYNNDGLRNVTVETSTIFPDNPNTSPFKDIVEIKSSRFKGAIIELTANSITAIDAKIPNIYYRTGTNTNLLNIDGYIPEVPQSIRTNLA